MTDYDAVVLGAGIHGLCAAFWLKQRGVARVAVLERFGAGHEFGSSHGALRITRSSYHEPALVRLAQEAHAEAWPVLERTLGTLLRIRTPGVFFGPPEGPFGAYLRAAKTTEVLQEIAIADARRHFPLLRFDDSDAVLLDHTAAMVLASKTMAGLREWLTANHTDLHWHCAAERIDVGGDRLTIATGNGPFSCRSAIVATGLDLARLAPELAPPLRVLRQQVGYFDVAAAEEQQTAGTFPVWARIGRTANDFHYGLPAHEGQGIKLAQHRTEGACEAASDAPPIDREALLQLARERLAVPASLTSTESCLYTMSPDHGLHVRTSSRSAHLVGIAACSGHGFKFGPVIGRRAAMLLPL